MRLSFKLLFLFLSFVLFGFASINRIKKTFFQGLGDLPGGQFSSIANAVSADGTVVVGASESTKGKEAFIWDKKNGMRSLKDFLENEYNLDLTDWTLETAEDISADGLTIVGKGKNPDGKIEAWIVRFDSKL